MSNMVPKEVFAKKVRCYLYEHVVPVFTAPADQFAIGFMKNDIEKIVCDMMPKLQFLGVATDKEVDLDALEKRLLQGFESTKDKKIEFKVPSMEDIMGVLRGAPMTYNTIAFKASDWDTFKNMF